MGSSCTGWKHSEEDFWKSCSRAKSATRSSLWPLKQLPLPSPGALCWPSCLSAQQWIRLAGGAGMENLVFYILMLGCVGGQEHRLGLDSPGTSWRAPFPGIPASPPVVNHPLSVSGLSWLCLCDCLLSQTQSLVFSLGCCPVWVSQHSLSWGISPGSYSPGASLLALFSLLLLLEFSLTFLTTF